MFKNYRFKIKKADQFLIPCLFKTRLEIFLFSNQYLILPFFDKIFKVKVSMHFGFVKIQIVSYCWIIVFRAISKRSEGIVSINFELISQAKMTRKFTTGLVKTKASVNDRSISNHRN